MSEDAEHRDDGGEFDLHRHHERREDVPLEEMDDEPERGDGERAAGAGIQAEDDERGEDRGGERSEEGDERRREGEDAEGEPVGDAEELESDGHHARRGSPC